MSDTGRGNPACPYLGLDDDSDTSLAFPSAWNTCHRSRNAASPNLKHQTEYCLSEDHRACMIFLAEPATMPLPTHLRASRRYVKNRRRNSYRNLIFIFVGILALVCLGWGFLTQAAMSPTVTGTPSQSLLNLKTPFAAYTATFTHIPTFNMTVPPEPILTGESAQKRQLDQPIGSDYKFVIHRILNGENLGQLASRYNTSVEAVLAVNYNLKTPIWEDALVIIPVGFTNVYGFPVFEAYEVPRANISLKVLALSFGASLKDLRYYNAIDMDESLQVGDWLLIPRLRLAPSTSTPQ